VSGSNGTGAKRRGRNGETVAESVKFGPLALWIGFNLRMAQEASFQAFSRRSQEIGENPGRFATLTLIARNPGISQTALSHANGRDKSSLTPVVEDLVRRGLVERKRVDSDRRAYQLPHAAHALRAPARAQPRPHHRHARPQAVPGAAEAHRGGDRVNFGCRPRESGDVGRVLIN
jgi:hypothetical protein